MSAITEPLSSLMLSLHTNGYTNAGNGLSNVITMVTDLERENDQLKKDLLNLLPIARENTTDSLSAYILCRDSRNQHTEELKFIDELTAKYTEGK